MILFFNSLGSNQAASYPATSQTPALYSYETNYRLGWWFHLAYDIDYPEGDERRRVTSDVDWTAMATEAANAGNVSFVCQHIKGPSGIRFFNSQTYYNRTPGQTAGVPLYSDNYNATNLAYIDDGFIDRYLDAFNAVGIDPFLYTNIGRDDNNYPSSTFPPVSATPRDVALYWQYATDLIIEILDKYGSRIKGLYFDALARVISDNDVDQQYKDTLYNAVKDRFPNIQITGNHNQSDSIYNGGNLKYFPIDIVGNEWYNIPLLPAGELNTKATTFAGETYYMPRQYGYSPLYRYETSTPSNEAVQYPWLKVTDFPDYTVNQIRSVSEMQAAYDEARSFDMAFWINQPVKHDGSLDATYLSRLNSIVV